MRRANVTYVRYNKRTQSPWEFIVSQLVKKFPEVYGTRWLITVFIAASHWSLSWARWNRVHNPSSFYLRSVLILYPNLYLDPPVGFSFLHDFLLRFSMPFYSFPFFIHTPSIASSSIWWSWWYLARRANYEGPHQAYPIFSSLVLLHPS
jgi:hypothetical protein